jgi:hypothetical protein
MLVVDVEVIARDDAADYLDPIHAPGNYKDAIKIAEYEAEARAKAIERAALAPDLNRIVLLGWSTTMEHSAPLEQRVCQMEGDERDALRDFWWYVDLAIANNELLVTFGGWSFDWPTVARRSQLLRVRIPTTVTWDKYRSPLYKGDLAHVLTFGGAIGFQRSLRTYARLFGLPVPLDEPSGADIAKLWAAGDIDAILEKNSTDLKITRALADRLGVA